MSAAPSHLSLSLFLPLSSSLYLPPPCVLHSKVSESSRPSESSLPIRPDRPGPFPSPSVRLSPCTSRPAAATPPAGFKGRASIRVGNPSQRRGGDFCEAASRTARSPHPSQGRRGPGSRGAALIGYPSPSQSLTLPLRSPLLLLMSSLATGRYYCGQNCGRFRLRSKKILRVKTGCGQLSLRAV